MNGPSRLTAFQLEVAQIFFGLTASDGFALAGGAALLANDLTSRPTLDLDFFRSTLSVMPARDELEAAANDRGWAVTRLRDHNTFVRLRLDGPETLLVDLCVDSPPVRPLVDTIAGRTFAPDELAGRKVVALFSRAEARDYADVFALLRRYPKHELLEFAAESDAGFDRAVFAEMLRGVLRHDDARLAAGGATADEIRSTFLVWASELEK